MKHPERLVLRVAGDVLVEFGLSKEEADKQLNHVGELLYTNKSKEAAEELAGIIRSLAEKEVNTIA